MISNSNKDDLWVQNRKIIYPEKLLSRERILPDQVIDCGGYLISPGFIDVQLNGGFGVNFSSDIQTGEEGVLKVAHGILAHGVTSFCPALLSSTPHVYHQVLPSLKKREGGIHGAEVLGAHVEGPFINLEQKGSHDPAVVITSFKKGLEGLEKVYKHYKHLEAVAIVTLAPELDNSAVVIDELANRGIVVSVGHSTASVAEGEEAVKHGASFITHLFNAMPPLDHRDPGLPGLLASRQIPPGKIVYYGIVADGNRVHPSTTRIAYLANPQGAVLVTDACFALGLTEGLHHIGQQTIEVRGSPTRALLQGTNTSAGTVAPMFTCIQNLWQFTGCTLVEAIEAATLHPATLMKIENSKGTLAFSTDADLTILNQNTLDVLSTWIKGTCVFENNPNQGSVSGLSNKIINCNNQPPL